MDLGGQRRKGCQLSGDLMEGRGSLCAGAGGGGAGRQQVSCELAPCVIEIGVERETGVARGGPGKPPEVLLRHFIFVFLAMTLALGFFIFWHGFIELDFTVPYNSPT